MKKSSILTCIILFLALFPVFIHTKAEESLAIGMNVRGMVYYGHPTANKTSALASHIDATLAEMNRMGATIVRVFAANNSVSDTEAAQRLDALLTKAASYNISVIITLIDFYHIGYNPNGTDHFYTDQFCNERYCLSLLGDDFFKEGYKDRYMSFVRTVVNANKGHSNIYAWEIGNELKNEASSEHFISFMQDVSATIKNLDASHAVATGMIGAWHTRLSPETLYGRLPNIDVITIHTYNRERGSEADANWANAHGKTAIVEEVGFSGTHDRTSDMRTELNFWKSKGVQAFMPWGFIAKEFQDNGDGDNDVGMDNLWHRADYDSLFSLFQSGAGGASIAAPIASPLIISGAADIVVRYIRDGAALGFAGELLKEAIQPVNYDTFLELEQSRINIGQEKMTVRAFGETFPFFEDTLQATGNDPVTFYVDPIRDKNAITKAGQFLYGWTPIPPGFVDEGPSVPPIPNSLVWPIQGGIRMQSYGCVPPFIDKDGKERHYSQKCENTTNLWLHNGLDIDAPGCEDPVMAAAAGEVANTGSDASYGNFIIIWHETLGISTIYNHLSSIGVQIGDTVDQSKPIAKAGHTGFVIGDVCGGEHLHFMVVTDKVMAQHHRTPVNPDPYF